MTIVQPKRWTGDLNGTGTFHLVNVPNVMGPVRVIDNAFRDLHDTTEYGIALNYYWKRQLLKWQTDFSWYQGGNPSSGGQSPAGFIAGSDGWMVRTQLQLAF